MEQTKKAPVRRRVKAKELPEDIWSMTMNEVIEYVMAKVDQESEAKTEK